MANLIGASATISRANHFTTYARGQCLRFVSDCATGGKMLGVYAPSAAYAWAHAAHHHTTGTPPAGSFVFFSTTRHRYGHVAISLGGGKIRHDWGGRAVTTTIGWVTAKGYKYLGWTTDLLGKEQPGIGHATTPARATAARPTLRRGAVGGAVKTMQSRLNHHGARLGVDGKFGPGTQAALRHFQSVKHLKVDGVCGPTTWAALLR